MWGNLAKQYSYKNEYSNLVLRKTKSFNKSRYSRNRQYYRTGVYWCLWLNIILVFALYYVFYRYTFKFSYIFIFYMASSILCLMSFFNKNYFLGFWQGLYKFCEGVSYDFILCTLLTLSKLKLLRSRYYNYFILSTTNSAWSYRVFRLMSPYCQIWVWLTYCARCRPVIKFFKIKRT
jgi:hypothetical protein